jgi:hypothetical protein
MGGEHCAVQARQALQGRDRGLLFFSLSVTIAEHVLIPGNKTAAESGSAQVAEELLTYYVHIGSKENFAATLFTCYGRESATCQIKAAVEADRNVERPRTTRRCPRAFLAAWTFRKLAGTL